MNICRCRNLFLELHLSLRAKGASGGGLKRGWDYADTKRRKYLRKKSTKTY